MEFIDRLEKVIGSGILNQGFPRISKNGATEAMIESEEKNLSRPLSEQHKALLRKWNGSNFDFIRVLGTHPVENDFLKELAKEYIEWKEIVDEVGDKAIYFANDITGFMYFELEDGTIVLLDTDGGGIRKKAEDMNDFFLNFLFGERADEYAGSEWLDELKEYGIV